MDDPLSYDIPLEPDVAHLVRKLITDFTIYETGMMATAETPGPLAARLFEGQMTGPEAQKGRLLIGYANGSLDVQDAATALRGSYRSEADRLEQRSTVKSSTYLTYLRKLLAQPDSFFTDALEMARPTLRGLAEYNRSRE